MNLPLRLHLDPPHRVAAGVLPVRGTPRQREAVRIRLRDEQAQTGLGEAIPLPGYSRDDAATAEYVLNALATQVADTGILVSEENSQARQRDGASLCTGRDDPGVDETTLLPAADRLDATLAPWAGLLETSPSARFALECALVDLLARRCNLTAARWLADGRDLQPVPVSVLLPDDDRAVCAAAFAAVAEGHAVLKLKIARTDRTVAEEDQLLAALRAAVDAAGANRGVKVLLRLDANGALDPALALQRLTALRRHGVELVEEPVAGAALLALPPLPLPWAADESLADPALTDALLALPPQRRPAALVLKPAQLGLSRCLRLAANAARSGLGLGLIVTHNLDGDLGHAAACALAAALPQPPWHCGLAPHAGLRRPRSAGPWLPLPTLPGLGVSEWDLTD